MSHKIGSKSHRTGQTRPPHQHEDAAGLSGDCGASKARDVLARAMTEAELQRNVLHTATLCGFRHFHPFNMRRSDSGWPDLVLVKPPRILAIELKRARKDPRPDQQAWLDALARCGIETHVWRPGDWLDGTVSTVLCGEDVV